MKPVDHQISDKRKIKPIVYEVKNTNEDITLQEIMSFKVGKSTLKFATPNSTAIFINIAEKELKEARSIYNQLIEPKRKIRGSFRLSDSDMSRLYDYFEHIKTSIIMAYTSVECVCNALVPWDYSFTEIDKNGIERVWNNKEIQRKKSTSQKLREILPKALNIKNPGQFKHYPTFIKLEELRNDIIHTRSVLPKDIKEREILYCKLLQDNVFKKIKSAYLLIQELHSSMPTHKVMPILYDTENLEKGKINSLDDINLTHTGNW